jgi:hypothetical protein
MFLRPKEQAWAYSKQPHRNSKSDNMTEARREEIAKVVAAEIQPLMQKELRKYFLFMSVLLLLSSLTFFF